jgi:hypothetical protein
MYNFLSIGCDCSTASVLDTLGLKTEKLPFDSVELRIHSLKKCFETDFKYFHTNVALNLNKTKIIDEYGIQYLGDYPTITNNSLDVIVDDWFSYYDSVKNDYDIRIEKFRSIVNDPKPCIVLSRYRTSDVLELQQLFITYYNRSNFYFVNASPEIYNSEKVMNINTEKNNVWNDIHIWKEGIQTIEKIVIDYLDLIEKERQEKERKENEEREKAYEAYMKRMVRLPLYFKNHRILHMKK